MSKIMDILFFANKIDKNIGKNGFCNKRHIL